MSIHFSQQLVCRSPVSTAWLLCFTWHLQAPTQAAKTALNVTRSIPPGNLSLHPHQCIIICSTRPPQLHVQSLTCALRVTSGTPRAALSNLSDNRYRVTCLHRQLPATFYLCAVPSSVIKNANWEWQSNREFHHCEMEWSSLAKTYERERGF